MTSEKIDALVVGSGPAGLMAATALAEAGRQVVVAEGKPSLGRKFLMAGKSGLNLTKDEPIAKFLANFDPKSEVINESVSEFDPHRVREWALGLGQAVFVGTSGRVFPDAMKASPLLRAWVRDLSAKGVSFRTRYVWKGWSGADWLFDTSDGRIVLSPSVGVLALGGASWPRLGSDGNWFPILQAEGVQLAPLRPANAGLSVDWSPHMARHFGEPVKGVTLRSGNVEERGEFVVSARGLEGGGIYSVSRPVREGANLTLDLAPGLTVEAIRERLGRQKAKDTLTNRLRKSLGLSPAKLGLLMEFGRPLPDEDGLAALVKRLPIRHAGLRPLAEAISTAGGVAWEAVDGNLMLKARPGVFVAGEMLDWEAPTGGYLLTGCFATGRWAGARAAKWPPARPGATLPQPV